MIPSNKDHFLRDKNTRKIMLCIICNNTFKHQQQSFLNKIRNNILFNREIFVTL